jgi:hypothetical protein
MDAPANLKQAQRTAAVISGSFINFYVLAAVSILLILLYFPRHDAWEEWLKQRP